MLNVVLYEPEIPANTGNIMRTCMAFNMKLHLIEPLGFSFEDKYLKRAHMDYINEVDYTIYPDYESFLKENSKGQFVFFTRYALKSFDECIFDSNEENIMSYLETNPVTGEYMPKPLKEYTPLHYRRLKENG